MSNTVSVVVRRLFDECIKIHPNLNMIDQYINECRSNNEDMNAFIYNTSRTPREYTILQIACFGGHHEIVDRLLDSNNNFKNSVDVNAVSNRYLKDTALRIACSLKCPLTVHILLQHPNIDINKADDCEESTPLHCACVGSGNSKSSIVMELLKHRDIQLTMRDSEGCIPLHSACIHIKKDSDIIRMLIGHQQQKHRIVQLNAKDNYHRTPLYCAVLYSHCNAVIEILKHEAVIDINAVNRDGQTLLHIACRRSFINNDTVIIIKNLLEQPSIMIHIKNNNDETPLDIIKLRLDKSYKHKHKQLLNEILQLFDDYHVRQRWRVYRYLSTYNLIVKITNS